MTRPTWPSAFAITMTLIPAWNILPAQDNSNVGDDKEALGKVAVVAYATNIHAFPFYRCRYRYTGGQAQSVQDALDGKFVNAISSEHRLLVDGPKDLYEGLTPPVPPDERRAVPFPGKKGVFLVPGSPIDSNRYLADGKREISYCPQLKAAGLWDGEKAFRGITRSPLGSMGVGHRSCNGPDVFMGRPDEYEMTSDGMEEVDGHPVVSVRFRNNEHRFAHRFSFDPARGYLPIRRMTTMDEKTPKTQVFVTEVRECSNQRWFPQRTVVVDIPDKAGDPFDVSELHLLEFDADHRPDASEFAIDVPAGTVVNSDDPMKFFKLKQQERVHLDDLPGMFSMLDEAPKSPLMDTALPHANRYRWLRWVGIGAGAAVALVGLIYLMRRRLWRQAA